MFYIIYVIVFLSGTVIGSFLNVCIYRIPEKQSIVFPGSHCFSCGHALKAVDLIPIFSFLFLGGRCRRCGVKLSPQYPVIELAAGLLAIVLAVRFGFTVNAFLAFIFCAGLLVVFMIDKKTMLIPDGMTVFLTAAAAVYRLVNWNGPRDFQDILWGLAAGSGALLILYIFGLLVFKKEVMGLGDIKLFVPIGILLGRNGTLAALYLSILLGGAAAAWLLLRLKDKKERRMAFGPFIALGAALSLYAGSSLIELYWKLLGL